MASEPSAAASGSPDTCASVLSWVHLSDIHVGEGNAADDWDQRGMLRELLRDVGTPPKGTPKPDVIFVTGDVAFSGSGRIRPGDDRSREYELAAKWLLEVGEAVGVGPERIFVIPGNHDVRRTTPADRQAMRLVNALRRGEPADSLDDALRDTGDRQLLTTRQQSFLDFAREFAPMCLVPDTRPERWLYWSCPIEGHGPYPVRIVGLNSALLCNDDTDGGKLVVNGQQLDLVASDDGARPLRIVLSHHPFNTEWLRNSKSARKKLTGRAHIVLSGHEHDAKIQELRTASQKDFVEVFAGALYASYRPPEPPASYTYNYATVLRRASGEAELRLWPRRWSEEAQGYRMHTDIMEDGAQYATWKFSRPLDAPGPYAASRPEPVLAPLPSILVSDDPRWLIGHQQAGAWLANLDLANRPQRLLRGSLTIENGESSEQISSRQAAGDQWRVGAIEELVQRAKKPGAVSPVFIHGLSGIGLTTLLLRYVASPSDAGAGKLFVDCASNSEQSVNTAKDVLRGRLNRLPGNGSLKCLVLVIDGLDLAWRAQAVRDGEPDAASLFAAEIRDFLKVIKDHPRIAGVDVVVVFTSSDPPSLVPGEDLVRTNEWASTEFTRVMRERGGICVRMDPSVASIDRDVWSEILPFSIDDLSAVGTDTAAFYQLPIFFDALRGTQPHQLKQLQTRRDFLHQGESRASGLGPRRHSYYKVLDQLKTFIKALSSLGLNDPAALRSSVQAIEKEITGEWMYLLPLNKGEKAVQKRMVELRDWLVKDRWRYSETYALSNLVSALAEGTQPDRQPEVHSLQPAQRVRQ
jgi:Calcineurin-like phosphoesterase